MLRRLFSFAAGCSLVAVGCSSSSAGSSSSPEHTGGARSIQDPNVGNVSIQIGEGTGEDMGNLVFAPDEALVVPVRVTPPGSYLVKFALSGDTLDAFLDKSEAMTDEDGSTSVVLTAP